MVITFISNFINHHQLPFCSEMVQKLNDDFHFIQTEPMSDERIRMGWGLDEDKISFVKMFYEDEEGCRALIAKSDVLMLGWTGRPEVDRLILESGKPVLRVSERIYREGQWKAASPRGLVSKYSEHMKYRNKPVYLLCCGAYVASDFALIHSYKNKRLKWGYFPETRLYDDKAFRDLKNHTGVIDICWAGRMITLKHPEFAIKLAIKLHEMKANFRLHMVGDGDMNEYLTDMVRENGISELVDFYGSMEPLSVRSVMEKAGIFLFTSNYLEGWGAVVNEAMNSGCALVASNEAGAVPFLIKENVNGLTYSNENYEEFEEKALYLVSHPIERANMGQKAYETITGMWNAKKAAGRLLEFCEDIVGEENGAYEIPVEGPMSAAEVIKPPGFKRTLQEVNKLQ